MGDNQLIHGLRRRYAKTLGQIGAGEDRGEDLAHLGAVILMFRPETDLAAIAPIRPYRSRKPGPLSAWVRAALDVLRTANGPLSAHDVALRIIAAQQLAYSPDAARNIRTAVRIAMQRREGVTVRREPGSPMRWTLAEF